MTETMEFQLSRRQEIQALHQKTIDLYFNDEGCFIWKENFDWGVDGSYRILLYHCLSYLYGDAHCVEKANQIIIRNYTQKNNKFTVSVIADILYHHRQRLIPEALELLERYLRLNLQGSIHSKICGYNDNSAYLGIHAMIVGGEIIGCQEYVSLGIQRLREAVEVFERNGFPCEYNSPNYAPVSLKPIAAIVEQTKSEQARELALKLELFYWQDVALHFHPATCLQAGPYSRGYVNDYSGMLSHIMGLLMYLFPDQFDIDLLEEMFIKGHCSRYINPVIKDTLPFHQSSYVWFTSVSYHYTDEIIHTMFNKETPVSIRGRVETGARKMSWDDEGAEPLAYAAEMRYNSPLNAPGAYHLGPKRGLITTYMNESYSLGTAQYVWLNNVAGAPFFATLSKGPQRSPEGATVYYSRMYYNDMTPYKPDAKNIMLFKDDGEVRTLQHENTAVVFYNPIPYYGKFTKLTTGIYRPLLFNEPLEAYYGDNKIKYLNYRASADRLEPVCINEGDTYVGIIPLPLTNLSSSTERTFHMHTYGEHLAITFLSYSAHPQDIHKKFSYEEIVETCSGFVFEIHPAGRFGSFAEFRQWMRAATVEDTYARHMRTTTYKRDGLKMKACYSPYHSAFMYATVNHAPIPEPLLRIEGAEDPGYALLKRSD